MKPFSTLAAALALSLAAITGAAGQVNVLALFPGKAMLSIDGKRRLLRAGERSPEGVRLISADSRVAVIEQGGRRERRGLGGHFGTHFAPRRAAEARIWRGRGGHFVASGSIDGHPVQFLVDTGATAVAMSESRARQLGLRYRQGRRRMVATASGNAGAWEVYLNRVVVGGIEQRNVRAMVVAGESPPLVLLGMSFLSRVRMEDRGDSLVLRVRN